MDALGKEKEKNKPARIKHRERQKEVDKVVTLLQDILNKTERSEQLEKYFEEFSEKYYVVYVHDLNTPSADYHAKGFSFTGENPFYLQKISYLGSTGNVFLRWIHWDFTERDHLKLFSETKNFKEKIRSERFKYSFSELHSNWLQDILKEFMKENYPTDRTQSFKDILEKSNYYDNLKQKLICLDKKYKLGWSNENPLKLLGVLNTIVHELAHRKSGADHASKDWENLFEIYFKELIQAIYEYECE